MLKTIAAVLVAASLVAGPVLAQGNAPATTGQPAMKAGATKATHKNQVAMTVKHHRHFAKVKVVRHSKHIAKVKAVKHNKHVKNLTKNKKAG